MAKKNSICAGVRIRTLTRQCSVKIVWLWAATHTTGERNRPGFNMKRFCFFPWCRSRDAGSRWRTSAFCHQPPKSLWKRKRQQDLRAPPLCNFLSKSDSSFAFSQILFSSYLQQVFESKCHKIDSICRFVSEPYRRQNDQMMREKQVQLQLLSMRLQQHLEPGVYCIH